MVLKIICENFENFLEEHRKFISVFPEFLWENFVTFMRILRIYKRNMKITIIVEENHRSCCFIIICKCKQLSSTLTTDEQSIYYKLYGLYVASYKGACARER